MRVLHFINDFTSVDGQISSAVRVMLLATAKVEENHLVTLVHIDDERKAALEEQYSITIHVLRKPNKKNPFSYFSLRRGIKKLLKAVQPDVVHVHAAWSYPAAIMECTARKRNFVTIVSPYGGLSMRSINKNFWTSKLLRFFYYQAWMVRRCVSVAALSEEEKEDIKNLGLKKRIEVLPEIHMESAANEPLCDALTAVYRKAVDTCYAKHLTPAEQLYVENTVKASVLYDANDVEMSDISAVSYRRICFYAYDEDVTDMVKDGADRLHLVMPKMLDIVQIPRYKNKKAKERGSLNDVELPNKKIRIEDTDVYDYQAVTMIMKAKKVSLKRLTLRRWTELYKLFRDVDFDEDNVGAELKRLGLRRTTLKIQKVLHKKYNLPTGYDIY